MAERAVCPWVAGASLPVFSDTLMMILSSILSPFLLARRSSVAPGRKIADPRQINDKGFKDRAVRKLIQYLMQNGYERTLSPQLLTAPSTKDFVYIISFLLKAAVPNFEFGRDSKFEEEVPSILKVLGYPVRHRAATFMPCAPARSCASILFLDVSASSPLSTVVSFLVSIIVRSTPHLPL